MKREHYVKKPLPCSFLDIQGVQNWLDEMALHGLFLDRLSYHNDRAFFKRGEPRPVRYRLDPVGKNWNDMERKELYAQAGWEFVDAVPRCFYIFSCDDPDAPELHSDPATLSYALKGLARRQTRDILLFCFVMTAVILALFAMSWKKFSVNLILMEYPLQPLSFLTLIVLVLLLVIISVFQIRKLQKLCRTLDDGLPLKAGRRHWRPNVPYLAIFLPAMVLFHLLNSYAMRYTTVESRDLDLAALSRPWPGLVQLEGTTVPAAREDLYSWMTLNHSAAAPVQEHYTNRWGVSTVQSSPGMQVWHYQTNSPAAARRLYRLERNKLDKNLRDNAAYPNSSNSITDLVPLAPRDHPQLDILETASFHHLGQEGWAFACLRENEILLVRYSGSAPLGDGLGLFLQALEKEVS